MAEPALDEILELETAVWEGLVAGGTDEEERLLSDDFLGVYPTGFASKAEVVAYLTANSPTVAEYSLSEARLFVLSDRDAMLSYRADFTRPGAERETAREAMYVSSLWSRRGDNWLNVFSQDTPVSDQPVP